MLRLPDGNHNIIQHPAQPLSSPDGPTRFNLGARAERSTSSCSTWWPPRGAPKWSALLGTVFCGILCNDRWVVYLTYHSGRMQLCWAHLKRNILGIADYARSPSSQQFCLDALAIVARLFRLWYRFRGDLRDRRGNPQLLDQRQLLQKSISLQKKLLALAEAHLDHADREVRNLATALFIHFERLFTHSWKSKEWSRPIT